ncbi:hypothetical protein [Streptomyces longwoodensis]|uniref:hypothetical protein n=1 Tax=Streptomyces longwoodensis TaxID=68231 RepID=UPI0033C8D16A
MLRRRRRQPEVAANINSAGTPDRPALLSAWGNFFMGLAALMTVCTAVATTYVAVATHQNQQDEKDENDEKELIDFAQRVEFTEDAVGVVSIDNPNRFPLGQAQILFAAYDLKSRREMILVTTPTVIPACSRMTISYVEAVKSEGKGNGAYNEKVVRNFALQDVAAVFIDRKGKLWGSSGIGVFRAGSTLNSFHPYRANQWTNVTSPVESGRKITKSARCLEK